MSDVGTSKAAAWEESPSRVRWWAWLFAVLVVLGFAAESSLWRPGTLFGLRENVQIAEAQAWWSGRLDLPERKWDTALYGGKVYSYFPPAFTLIAGVIVPFAGGVPHVLLVGLAAVATALIYSLFQRMVGAPFWAAVLAIAFVLGTSAWPVFNSAMRSGSPYHVNHLLAVIGTSLMLRETIGSRRIWLMIVGFALAVWSRQMLVAFALPLLWVAWDRPACEGRRFRMAAVTGSLIAIGGLYLGLNAAKFGHPLRTGYMLNHEQRDDVFARESRAHGLLSGHWVPRNLYHANLGLPRLQRIESEGQTQYYLRPSDMGTGIWWTTPVLLWLFVDIRRTWRDPMRRVWLIATVLLFAMLTFWHATGAVQRGYNRYSLDYMLVLWALILPACLEPKRQWITVSLLAWGVLYFRVMLAWPHVRVW